MTKKYTTLKVPADQIERIKREARHAELMLHTGVFIFLIGAVLCSVAIVGMFYPVEPAWLTSLFGLPGAALLYIAASMISKYY